MMLDVPEDAEMETDMTDDDPDYFRRQGDTLLAFGDRQSDMDAF